MKGLLQRMLYAVLLYSAAGSVSPATVFVPTDGDVNFLFGDLGGGFLAMFDDGDQNFNGPYINVPVPSVVGIFGPINGAGVHLATNEAADSLTLTGSDQFILGLNVGGNWLTETSITPNGGNAYTLSYDNGGSLVLVDVTPIPLPAALWLFGSGVLGFMALRRPGDAVVVLERSRGQPSPCAPGYRL